MFGDNCAACHGRTAHGGKGFPNLTTNSWLWGGTPEAIFQTITVGINSAHPDTRVSQMPAFGKDGMLPRADIDKAIAFVRSLSPPSAQDAKKDLDPAKVAAGKELFAANCASCHGEDAKGNIEMGAPNLTDPFWIYGGDPASIAETLWGGRQGHMPTWKIASRRSTARSSRFISSTCGSPTNERGGHHHATRPTLDLAAGRCRIGAGDRRQLASGLCRRHLTAGLRRACAHRREWRGRFIQRGDIVVHAPIISTSRTDEDLT